MYILVSTCMYTCLLVGILMVRLSLSQRSLRTNFSANFFSTGRVGADTGWLSISATDVQSECSEQFDCM